ncbi:MAG: flippase-like domain-containing protein [Solirubrobacteraceae bacterium]
MTAARAPDEERPEGPVRLEPQPIEYSSTASIRGPLIVIEGVRDIGWNEVAEIRLADGEVRHGVVLDVHLDYAIVEVLEGTAGMRLDGVRTAFGGGPMSVPITEDWLGRVCDGRGEPLDGGPPILSGRRREINGTPINPAVRVPPSEPIITGVSAIDGLATLVRGQKLPIFSVGGLPHLELAATSRQRAIDVAELLTSLAGRIGPDRAVATAAAAIGADGVATAVPLLQPLALSAGTRRAIKGQDGLLKNTRAAAIAASGDDADQDLAQLQRVRPRTLLAIAALAGAFYFLLPQIAQVSSSWHALQHANWAWLPVIIGLSALTYVASAIALIGSVPGHVPFGPAVLTQGASSFINRVSPANVGGMALNARFLQKSGTSTPASVAAVGVNSLAGAVMHMVLIVVFFALAGHDLTKAFKLPSGSKILLLLAVIIAVIGVVLATRPGRRWTRKQLIPGVRSAAGSLRQAAASPVKLGLLFGGSALITLLYIAGLAASVQAFGTGPGLVVLGAVYLGAAALAAVAPTPGGLGAIEAALVAGLTGVGMQAGPAVSAVLLYRLATYWLPVLPGWLCWRFLQHRGYV